MAANKLQAALKNRASGNNNPGQVASDPNEETEGYVFGAALREKMEKQAEQEPLRETELSRLLDNPYQRLARSVMDDEALKELANSIRSVGFHGALLARPKPGQTGYFELAYGHRRRRAAELAGLTTLPVKVVGLDDTQMLLIMAGENFARVDLDPLHEAMVVGEIVTTQNLSAREIALRIGKSQRWVEQRLNLYNAPQNIQEFVQKNPNKFGHAQILVPIKDTSVRTQLIQEIIDNDLTQAQLTERVRQLKTPPTPASPIPADSLGTSTPTISSATSPIAATQSPAAPTPTNTTTAATPSAVPTPASTAGAGPAPSPASAGSSPHIQQPQPQPPAPMPGLTPAPQRQPPYHPLPPMTAPPSVGPIPGVANPAGFATVDEFLKLEAKAHAAANDISLRQVTPAEDSEHDDLLEQTFGYGDDFGDGGDPQSDLSDLYAASTNIEDYLPQPASVWGMLVAQLAVDAARLENMGQSVEVLSMMTTGEWEVLDRTIRQLQSLFAKLG